MTDKDRALMQDLLVAQVLVLEKAIAAEKKQKGITMSGDYFYEAVQHIKQSRPQVLSLLSDTR